ncbi:MAG: DNA polymerase III subunit gamma/tau [Candidatus Omnitrophica bacterium]|nr:DNA polymerase III subunit gamma/tau [Candidatus Omnitrophota bacterium]MDD5430295.1 DNA polymerase III subunit gamma/tau [Candidatus Omnitrophota bacterium]
MEYVVFALKYRPADFDGVVGQENVVMSLKNAIISKRVHHAYLFSGPRGVGKTSLARIFAKSLNCFEGPKPKPCGKCLSCVEIAKNQSLDVIEIDGASNRGIDEIRTLRENVKLSAAHSRYKIYIIDEVHMLTQEAFNALLKTLEEPPAHVKFIFATTHPHKVPPTILSRCQKFQFNLLPVEKVVFKLKKIVEAEKLDIKDSLLHTIAQASGGSIRDAESLLDQVVPVILEKGSLEDVFSFLGIVDEESLNQALDKIIKKDLPSCLEFIEKLSADGKDLGIFLNGLIEHARNLLLAKISPKNFKELSELSPQGKDAAMALTKVSSTADILRFIDLLIEAKDLSRTLNTARIPFELALIKYCHKPETRQSKIPVKNTESVSIQPKKNLAEKINPIKNVTPIEALGKEIDDADFDLPINKAKASESKADIPAQAPLDFGPEDDALLPLIKARWNQIITYIQKVRAAIASHLHFSQPVSSRGCVVTIGFLPANYFHKEIVETAKNVQFIEEAMSKIMEKKVGVKFELKDTLGDSRQTDFPQEAEEKPIPEESKAHSEGDDEFLNDLLDTFGGKFQTEE